MEPRIQYAKTSGGVNIAYAVSGSGAPLVHMGWFPMSHLQAERNLPEIRRWCERLSDHRKLVRYDGRGTGLSERDVTDFSIDARLWDLEAVVERLSLDRFVLYGACYMGPVAIAYAVRHPERVSHLVLWAAWARASVFYEDNRMRAVYSLLEHDWELYTETVSRIMYGWGEAASRQLGEIYRLCIRKHPERSSKKKPRSTSAACFRRSRRRPWCYTAARFLFPT